MAACAPFSSFLSSLLPSKPSPAKLPPTQLLSSPSLASQALQNQKPLDAYAPLVLQQGQAHPEPLSAEVSSVICPSLAFSNTLYFKSTYSVQVVVDDNEPEERLLNRFRREVVKAGIIQECKRMKFFGNQLDEKTKS